VRGGGGGDRVRDRGERGRQLRRRHGCDYGGGGGVSGLNKPEFDCPEFHYGQG
jgi:hypothetical protein